MDTPIMENQLMAKKRQSKIDLEWLFQLIASLAWLISVFIYGSFEIGDCFQLLAASAWTVANIVSYVNHKNPVDSKD